MIAWNKRSRELAYLLNPAFCGAILYYTVKAYEEKKGSPMSLLLAYLVLPIILHRETCEKLDSHSHLSKFVTDNPDLFISYSQRAKSLLKITNETIEFLLANKCAEIDRCCLIFRKKMRKSECAELKKAQHLGRMFARAGTVETIFLVLGVKP